MRTINPRQQSWRRVLPFAVAGGLALGAGPILPAAPAAAALAPQSTATATAENQIRYKINAIRRQRGLVPVKANATLNDVARQHSRQMATQGFFSHTGLDGSTVGTRVKRAGLKFYMVGENLFRTNNPDFKLFPDKAVNWWMGSTGHRNTILTPGYRETGVGIWRANGYTYVTQIFYRRP